MLGGAWLAITLGLLVAAIVLQQVPLFLVALLFFLTSGVARLWARFSLERVEYDRHLSASRAFFGETITLEVRITNRKMLPLPWVHIRDEVPEELAFLKGHTSPSPRPSRLILSNFLSLGWYQRLTRRYTVQCLQRGHFSFGPASMQAGDLFGFFQQYKTEERTDYLMVYPRILPLEELGIPSRDPFGDLRVRRHLFEDPVRAMSIRDYVHGDPMKRIHWKASARLRRLQTRVFETTTTVDLALFLDVRTVPPPLWGISEQLLETAVMAAASLANHAVQQGYRIGFYATESYRYSNQMIKLPPSDHPDQMQRVLEALAQLQGLPMLTPEEILNREGRALAWGTNLVMVTAVPTEVLLASLNQFRRAGRRVTLVVVGGQAPAFSLKGIPIYHVSDQVYWRELAAMQLRGLGGAG